MTWRWGTCYMGNSQSSNISSPRHTSELASNTRTQTKTTIQPGEDTPASPYDVDTTRGATVIGYKPLLDRRKAWRQGLLPLVEGILGSHWTAIARHGLLSSLGAWGLGTIRNAASPQLAHQATNKKTEKRPTLNLGTWNVRTMLTGISEKPSGCQ